LRVLQRFSFLLACVGSLGVLRNPASLGSIPSQARGFALCIFASLIGAGAAIAVATFAMQGFNIPLPANPENYELLRQIGFR
jgi:hypothetical protein